MSDNAAAGAAPATVADLLRRFRKREQLSQAELASAAGVSDGMIGNVERGTRNLGVETVERVADALHLTDDERAELVAARKRFGQPHHNGHSAHDDSWDDLKSSLSEEDRAAVRAIIDSLRAKNY